MNSFKGNRISDKSHCITPRPKKNRSMLENQSADIDMFEKAICFLKKQNS